ncbi:hypothetical protein MC885_021836 [Smutsia gigantea]|nr:hypothetical protein MC885_021836 [Smutsia gigantea]
MGTVGGSLSVQCRYGENFAENNKYWCRNSCLSPWKIVETTGSEREERHSRVSIRDHPANLTFTVTMESLTEGDSGTYWCGIDTPWLDGFVSLLNSFHFLLLVFLKLSLLLSMLSAVLWVNRPQRGSRAKQSPLGCFSIKGPRSVRGIEQGSVTVQCNYDSRWKTYQKWWCRGAKWDYCKILIQTTGSEQEVKRNRVSIRDNQTEHLLTVTMKEVRQDDTDTYWCGIHKTGIDLGARIRVTIDPGTVLTTPEAANNRTEEFSGSYTRTHYVLLVFVKVPFLLILVGAFLWLKEPQRPPSNFSPDLLSKDTAP